MQDIFYPELDQILMIMKEFFYGITLVPKKYHFYTFLRLKDPHKNPHNYKRIPILYKNKVYFLDTLSRRTYFWDTVVPCGSENSHNVVQLNPTKINNIY